MSLLKRALFLLVSALVQGARGQQLFVTSPNVLRINTPELAHLDGFDLPGGSAEVQLKLQTYPDRENTFSESLVTVRNGRREDTRLMITLKDLVDGSLAEKNYVYSVADCPALGFHRESVILVTGVQGYLFLQTDKPIYTPHQNVHLRVVSLDPNMYPSDTEFTIDIKNPNGILFHRYDRRRAENGFVQETFKLPTIASIGNWTVEAKYRNEYQEDKLEAISFEVREYVPPTFSLKISSPNFILWSTEEVFVEVEARYVFGNLVIGSADVLFSILYEDGSRKIIGKKREQNFEGINTFALTREDFQQKNLWFPQIGSKLSVEAIVTERATGKIELKIDTSASFVQSPYIISFERTPTYFKPGLPFLLNIDVKFANNLPAAKVPVSVAAGAETEREGRVAAIAGYNAEQRELSSNSDGRVSIWIDVPADAEELEIKVKTNIDYIPQDAQAEKEFRALRQVSRSDRYLAIKIINRESRIQVGDNILTRVHFSDSSPKKVTYMVLARGRLVERFTREVDGQIANEDIAVTASMSPQTRLLVYYAKNNEVIADLIVLDVEYKCDSELSITQTTAGENIFGPRDLVNFKITGEEGAWVALLAVDKTVYESRSNDILSRDKMFRAMMEMDLGCGPGGGRDSMSIFKNAGVSILTNVVDEVPELRGSISCPGKTSRKRRSVSRVSRGIRRGLADILATLNAEEPDCCFGGVEKAPSESRLCNESSQSEACQDSCCERQKALMLRKKRSSGALDGGWLDINEDEVEIEEREHFPETWFNEYFQISKGNEYILSRSVPDSITTWVISGVSVASSTGMCVAEPFSITAKKPFFVVVDLPYAAILNEQLLLKATVYNFERHDVQANVYMTGDQDGLCFTTDKNERSPVRRVEIAPGAGETVTFPIIPLKTGEYKLTVSATNPFISDRVTKPLRVRAEGVRRTMTESTRLDPQGVMENSGPSIGIITDRIKYGRQLINVPLKFPDDSEPGTEACSLHFVGDLKDSIVPPADLNLSRYIRAPAGNAENTVIYMGPLVYSTRYMKITGMLTSALENRIYPLIQHGYERLLTYKKADGSYATWVRLDSSTWLTAFVTKIFCQAREFPVIGEQVEPRVQQSIEWLFAAAQNSGGHFEERGRIYHGQHFGQTLLNDATLTAFVVEAISKCSGLVDLSTGRFAIGLRNAVQYLERYFESNVGNPNQVEPYTAAIVAYALTLQNSEHRYAANALLREKASYDSATGMRFWSADGITEDSDTPVWYRRRAPTVDIKTASYALLNQLALGNSGDYFSYSGPIASWLIRQRTKSGAFRFTTETILGLEALARYASQSFERDYQLSMHIRVLTGLDEEPQFTLTEANANSPVVITEGLPIGEDLTIGVEGTGIGQLQVECTYNSPEREGMFDLEIITEEYNPPGCPIDLRQAGPRAVEAAVDCKGNDSFVVQHTIKFRYIGKGDRVGMSLMEVILYSGFRPVVLDLEGLVKEKLIDRYEVTSNSLLMYITTVAKAEPSTVSFRTEQVSKVGEIQPVSVRLYDFYKPDKHHSTVFYHPMNGSALLGTFCDEDENGRKVCSCAETECAEYWGFNRSLGGPRLKRMDEMIDEACFIYDYAMKIEVRRVEKSAISGIAKMTGTVFSHLKHGAELYRWGDEVSFVWQSKCDNPHFVAGHTYLVMGMDGNRYVDRMGRSRIRYVLDYKSYAVEWPERHERPMYHAMLNSFARRLAFGGPRSCMH